MPNPVAVQSPEYASLLRPPVCCVLCKQRPITRAEESVEVCIALRVM